MIRVLVADDHPVVRQGLCTMLEIEPDIEVVGRAEDGVDAVAQAATADPDIILMDVQMPRLNGIEALKKIRAANSDAQVIVLTTYRNEDYIFPSLDAGARGYLLKDSSREELANAIRRVFAGESLLDPTIAAATAAATLDPPAASAVRCPLTAREMDVLRLMADRHNNSQIATRLFVSENTVKTHVSNIFAKLGCSDRSAAVLMAWKFGWV